MIIDGDMILCEGLAMTAAGTYTSTNVVDFGAAGVGHDSKVLINIPTAAASSGSATVTFNILTDDNSSFSSATTLWTSGALTYSTLTAGKTVVEFTLPFEVEQYIEVTAVVATAALTAGTMTAYVDSARQTNGI